MKYLFINPFGLGDVLFTTPLINAIKVAQPQSSISYWCNERVGAIFEHDPRIDKVFALSRGDLKKIYRRSKIEGVKRSFRLFSQIKAERFDVCFDFSLDHRYGLFARIAGIGERIGYNYKHRGRFLTRRLYLEGYRDKHVVEYYLALLPFAGINASSNRMTATVSESAKNRSRMLLKSLGVLVPEDMLVAIAPAAGASWGKQASLKHWPAIRFAQLADRLIGEHGVKVLLLGDESERPVAEIIRYAMKHRPVDLVGKTTLEEFAALLTYSRILVTNDGGPLHLAVALQVPTVSIFGPVDEHVYGPYPPDPRHIVVAAPLPCRPCYQGFKMEECLAKRECIQAISTEKVYEAVRRLL